MYTGQGVDSTAIDEVWKGTGEAQSYTVEDVDVTQLCAFALYQRKARHHDLIDENWKGTGEAQY